MKQWNQLMVAGCVAIAATACSGDRDADTAKNDRPAAVGTSGSAASDPAKNDEAGRADRDFVGDMMADGRAEVELGKMAQQKARNRQVKEFASMMVRDHTKAGAELKTVASHANVDMAKIDADMDDHKDVRDRLAKLSGMEFDREYMKAMVDEHEKAVDDVEAKAEKADNDHVKEWAAKTLPTLKKHLEEARQIQESLEKR
jgi:putative membrane protein